MNAIVAVVSITAFTAAAMAAETIDAQTAVASEYKIWGQGLHSCGDWTNAHSNSNSIEELLEEAWLSGYMSAMDEAGPGPRSPQVDFNAMIEWMSNYCQANPLDDLAIAASALRVELMKREDPR
jgi:hypothetical protein